MKKNPASPAWEALGRHYDQIAPARLRDLFKADPARSTRFTLSAAGWRFDFSKHRITDETMRLLFALARERKLEERRDAMFSGGIVNTTEKRAALHVALRAPADAIMEVGGENVVPGVQDVLSRMAACANTIRDKRWVGSTGRPIRNIVNIGIGGSDLGPAMAYEALRYYSDRDLTFRFVSNVDGTDFHEAVHGLRADETMFIVASKTFTTLETMTNAQTAREWIRSALGQKEVNLAAHFLALSTHEKAVSEFGIPASQMFEFHDWVGGRYSMDSAIGLSTMIAIGPDGFREMLSGFHAMDEHFRTAALEENIPVTMGLLNVWYTNMFGSETVAVLPYSQYLKRFPAYLQQLTMESNGKHVRLDGKAVNHATGAIFWGEPGTNGQHSFYQLIHQGTHLIPCDFIAFAHSLNPSGAHQDLLIANVIAQAEALAIGKTIEEVLADGVSTELAPHKVMEGNRPSSLLFAEKLTPESLGALIAAYEHSVFVQAAIWDINPFDQWGVELGKKLATRVADELSDKSTTPLHDSSTNAAIQWYRERRSEPSTPFIRVRTQRVMVLDVGGSHVKVKLADEEEFKFASGPAMTPSQMLSRLARRLGNRRYDAVSIGFPALIVHGRIATAPMNLGEGWPGFDFTQALGRPVKLVNDAAMQAIGSYEGGRMLFLGLGTGLGTAMMVDGVLEPMELAHLAYKKRTYEYYVSTDARKRLGAQKWQTEVFKVIDTLRAALEPDYIVLGGGNVRHLRDLPSDVRRGDNANAFKGGFRLWEQSK